MEINKTPKTPPRHGAVRFGSFAQSKERESLLQKFNSNNRNVITDMLLALFIIEPVI